MFLSFGAGARRLRIATAAARSLPRRLASASSSTPFSGFVSRPNRPGLPTLTRGVSSRRVVKPPRPPPAAEGRDLFDRLFAATGTRVLVLGGGALATAIAFVPAFAATRDGATAAWRYEPSGNATYFYELCVSALGGYGGIRTALLYAERRLAKSGDPVMASLRMPWAAAGGCVAFFLCQAFAPLTVRVSCRSALTLAYGVEGLGRDVFGMDQGKLPTWEGQNETRGDTSMSRWRERWDQYRSDSASTLENSHQELEDSRRAMKEAAAAVDRAADVTAEAEAEAAGAPRLASGSRDGGPDDGTDQAAAAAMAVLAAENRHHVDNLAAGLAALRNRESALQDRWKSTSSQKMKNELQRQLDALEQEKGDLKREGRLLGANISHVLNDNVNALVDELSDLRLEQEKLAAKIAFAKSVSDAHTWTARCREIDARKYQIKQEARAKYQERVSSRAATVPRWTDVANSGK